MKFQALFGFFFTSFSSLNKDNPWLIPRVIFVYPSYHPLQSLRQGGPIPIMTTEIHTADDLLKHLYGDNIQLPVDVWRIAEKLGIVAMSGKIDDENVSAVIYKKDVPKPFRAVINSDESHIRRRLIVAHVIGHYIQLYQDLPADKIAGIVDYRDAFSSMQTNPREVAANRFALSLLMPERELLKLWGKGYLFEDIADEFRVSRSALATRLKMLNL